MILSVYLVFIVVVRLNEKEIVAPTKMSGAIHPGPVLSFEILRLIPVLRFRD